MRDDATDSIDPEPERPLPSDCCDGGCTRCVFDVYADELQAWQERRKRLNSGA